MGLLILALPVGAELVDGAPLTVGVIEGQPDGLVGGAGVVHGEVDGLVGAREHVVPLDLQVVRPARRVTRGDSHTVDGYSHLTEGRRGIDLSGMNVGEVGPSGAGSQANQGDSPTCGGDERSSSARP